MHITTQARLAESEEDKENFNAYHAIFMSLTPPLITSLFSSPSWPAPSAKAAPCNMPVYVLIYDGSKPQQVWPQSMYTADIIVGFQQIDIPRLHSFYGQDQLFYLIFGNSPFIKAIYHENHKIWCKTLLIILESHKQSGHT